MRPVRGLRGTGLTEASDKGGGAIGSSGLTTKTLQSSRTGRDVPIGLIKDEGGWGVKGNLAGFLAVIRLTNAIRTDPSILKS